MNSKPYLELLHFLMPRGTSVSSGQTLKYEIGYVTSVPIPSDPTNETEEIGLLAREAWSLKRSLDTSNEISHAFVLPGLLQVQGNGLTKRSDAWAGKVNAVKGRLKEIENEIDALCFGLYGIDQLDLRAIAEVAEADVVEVKPNEGPEPDEEELVAGADTINLAEGLVSWAIGAAFGRFDYRLATGDLALPLEPDPFDNLPSRSPAMLTASRDVSGEKGSDRLPEFVDDGILVDDSGHARDLTSAVRNVFARVFGADLEAWWSDVGSVLVTDGQELSSWVSTNFFENHLKVYGKSRRKAPLIWQLSVRSGRYSVWLYAPRLDRDSFIRILNDVALPKLEHEERQLTTLKQSIGENPTTKENRDLEDQTNLVEELRTMVDEVKRVAPLWYPSLDDGIVLMMAPLWRLVAQHKQWQNELKSKWDGLASGEYDWSHLAMHLWPERVVPKCSTDRSLAIAHGLEKIFWYQDDQEKWVANEKPLKPVEGLIRERSSPAVKSALKSVLEAPNVASSAKRSRKARAA